MLNDTNIADAVEAKAIDRAAREDANEALVKADSAEKQAEIAIDQAEYASILAENVTGQSFEDSLSEANLAITAAKEAIQLTEFARKEAETARNKAEEARLQAESIRNKAEEARLEAEGTRTDAEKIRGLEEKARLRAEEDRKEANIAKEKAETALIKSEKAIEISNLAREKAEWAQEKAEANTRALLETQKKLQDYATKLQVINQDLEQFASIASHDLQAPLRKIKIFADQLQADAKDKLTAEDMDSLNRIQKSAHSMQALITDLLALARVAHQKPFEQVDLAQIIAHVLSNLSEQIKAQQAVIEIGEMVTVVGDAGQLQQLFQNLIENALKFQADGTTPVIKISSNGSNPEFYEMIVADNGIGFAQEKTGRIFESFIRLHKDSAYPGSGMGLAICKRIVERHHGTITVKSTPGEGSSFVVRLSHKPE